MPRTKKFHTWEFYRLYDYVEYKAEAEGIDVTQVDPAYTSQRCSRCGHTVRNNRTTQADFSCHKCGYTVHADYNVVARLHLAGSQNMHVLTTAKNVGLKHVRAAPQTGEKLSL